MDVDERESLDDLTQLDFLADHYEAEWSKDPIPTLLKTCLIGESVTFSWPGSLATLTTPICPPDETTKSVLEFLFFVGLVFATLFFALSVSPSLLPRPYFFQGILSGIAIAIGYSVGVTCDWLYRFLELPAPQERVQRILKITVAVAVAIFIVHCLRQMTFWQNSIRQLMEMPSGNLLEKVTTELSSRPATPIATAFIKSRSNRLRSIRDSDGGGNRHNTSRRSGRAGPRFVAAGIPVVSQRLRRPAG